MTLLRRGMASEGGHEKGRGSEGKKEKKKRKRQGDERELMMTMTGGCDTVSGAQ